MEENSNIELFRVGPCLFDITFPASGRRPTELVPSLTPFLLSEEEAAEKSEKSLFSLTLLPPGNEGIPKTETATEEATPHYRQLVEFEWEGARCTISATPDGRSHLISILTPDSSRAYSAQFQNGFATSTLTQHGTATDGFALNNILMMVYAFNTACRDTLLMHASVIKKGGKAYLFLGKSGTGKSTHSRLWLEHIPGCELLNDDNPIVHYNKETGKAIAYGSPWSGKTPCYKNSSAPVGAFVRLEQAPENDIKREGAARAFASLLPSCSCLKEAEALNNGVIETVKRLAASQPVYHLKCLPDRAAAELCFNNIRTKEG